MQKNFNDLIDLEYGVIKYLCVERERFQKVSCAILMIILTSGRLERDVCLSTPNNL